MKNVNNFRKIAIPQKWDCHCMHNYLKTTCVITVRTPIQEELIRIAIYGIFLNGSSIETKFYTNEVLWQKIINSICSSISNSKGMGSSYFRKCIFSVTMFDKYIA